jgi:hypothetical protein
MTASAHHVGACQVCAIAASTRRPRSHYKSSQRLPKLAVADALRVEAPRAPVGEHPRQQRLHPDAMRHHGNVRLRARQHLLEEGPDAAVQVAQRLPLCGQPQLVLCSCGGGKSAQRTACATAKPATV